MSNTSSPTLNKLRDQAMALFSKQAWPNRKQEAWKYTPTLLLQKHALDLDHRTTLKFDTNSTKGLQAKNVTEENVQVYQKFFTGQAQDSALILLNHALWQEAWIIHVTKQDSTHQPLHIKLSTVNENQAQYSKLIFVLEPGAELQVIIDHTDSPGFSNLMIHTELAENACITFLDCCNAGASSLQFMHHTVQQSTHSTFNHYALALQAKWLRHELNIHLHAPHAKCQLNGLYFGEAAQFIDHHLCVNHKAPHCHSNQFYKGVLTDQAHAVFNGKVIVAKDAQKTISSQKNHNILLSGAAEIDTKPELEIYADDVLCSHGATVGALSSDALFYLISRGIEPDFAKKILVEAFMQEVSLQCGTLTDQVTHLVAKRLAHLTHI